MITKEQFIRACEIHQQMNKYVDDCHDVLNIDVIEMPSVESFWELFDIFIDTNFTEEGVDDIMWYLCEKQLYNGECLEMYDENNNIIPTDTLDDLWEIVKEYRK